MDLRLALYELVAEHRLADDASRRLEALAGFHRQPESLSRWLPIGIAGLAGILLPLNQQSDNQVLFWVTIGVVLLAGVVMSARLQLHAHTPRQVLVGALTGLLIGFFGVILQF